MEKKIWSALAQVLDPELNVSIVDLGLIYNVLVEKEVVFILLTLTSPGCPLADQLIAAIQKDVRKIKGVKKVKVNLTFEPLWTPQRMTASLRRKLLI